MNDVSSTRSRRAFLGQASMVLAGGMAGPHWLLGQESTKPAIELGVHHYSVRDSFRSGELTLRSFPRFAREALGVSNMELAAELSEELLESESLVSEIRRNGERFGVRVLTLLCSAETALDADTKEEREEAVTHHLRWVTVARALNCRFLRIRAGKMGDPAERMEKAVAGIRRLCDRLQPGDPRPLIENVGGLSRRPEWLMSLAKRVGWKRCGLLADYGNFEGDVYEGMEALLPFAESLCTKSWDFDNQGNETKIDFLKMGQLIKAAGFKGCVSIEYLGKQLGGKEGVKKTASLVRRSLR